MSNGQIEEQIPDVNSAAVKISPVQRAYAFGDLPEDVRQKLLRLQNSDGDFLKLSSGETERRIVLLVLVMIAAICLAAVVADSAPDWKKIVVFCAVALLLSIWFGYLIRGIYNAFKTPLKNRIYLTPAQVIETLDGTVRYRELKDANEISVNKFSTDIGRRNKLNITFDDGDAYRFYIPGMANSKQIALTQKWRETAANWKREAVGASGRGATNYLKPRDIFSTVAGANTPVLPKKTDRRTENILLIATIALLAVSGGFIYFLSR